METLITLGIIALIGGGIASATSAKGRKECQKGHHDYKEAGMDSEGVGFAYVVLECKRCGYTTRERLD